MIYQHMGGLGLGFRVEYHTIMNGVTHISCVAVTVEHKGRYSCESIIPHTHHSEMSDIDEVRKEIKDTKADIAEAKKRR